MQSESWRILMAWLFESPRITKRLIILCWTSALQKTTDYVWDASGTNLDIRTTFVLHFTHIMAALEPYSNPLIMITSW
jgi:hypothetical protein